MEIKTREVQLAKGDHLAKDASLLKVRVIKKKFVEQMPRYQYSNDPKFSIPNKLTIIGLIDDLIVAARKNGHFFKMYVWDYAASITPETPNFKKDKEYIQSTTRHLRTNLPQLFED